MLYTCLLSLPGHVCMACLVDLVPGIPAQFGGCSDETSLLSTGIVLLPATGGLPESKLLPSRSLFLSSCHVLTMLHIRTCAGTMRCMHHGSTDSGQCWKDCTWGESWRCRISIEEYRRYDKVMLNLPRSELQSADPSFSYICAGTDGPCTTIDWRHRVEPINPAPNDAWKYQTHPFWRGAPRYVRRPQMGCCDFAGADWLAPHRHHSLRLGKVTPSLSSYILIYIISRIMSWTMSDLCEIHDFDMIYLWYPLIHYDLYSWQSDISGMTHPRWWTWGKSWEW